MSKHKSTPGGRGKKKTEVSLVRSSAAEYLTFVAAIGDSEASVEMRYEDENIWLTQRMMAELYGVSVPAINQHLKRIFSDNELEESAVVKSYLITASDGKNYQTKHYSLQAIIAVGFKIENERAVQFRKWANQIVKDYTIQGWTMDAERLKHGGTLTDEFFERQLEKIREIRLSERKFYQKITDIYATALDYDPSATATKRFFAAVQNKMHYAVQAMGDDQLKLIAAELISQVKKSVTIDWTLRESARARIKVMVKRILNKHGYPPDLQEDAVKTVLAQAELLCAEWV